MDLVGRAGRRFSDLCRDLFVLAQDVDATPGPGRGWRWEAKIADALARRGFPVESAPGGIRVHGVLPASGLAHQTDAGLRCVDAYVIGEWKAYTGQVPKNEVLRFKAATDDIYDAISSLAPRRPVFRLFGVAGDASPELRWYAARHGVVLVERSRWPAPVLVDEDLPWPPDEAPMAIDLKRLYWLCRPLQEVYPRLPDGSLRLPRRLPNATIESLLALHDRLSDRFWEVVESYPGSFEQYAAHLCA